MSERLIDRLVVALSLNADAYKKTEKEVAASTKKTAETVEKGATKGDTNDKKRDREKIKRERAEAARKRKAAQEQERQNAKVKDQLTDLGKTAAVMFIGFETLKGAITAFNAYTTNVSGMGRTTQNLGVDIHDFQSFGAAIKLAGGDADSAKAQFASMAQAVFALTTRGEISPFTQALATFGVYARDAKGQIKPLTDLLNELADAMERRGLNRAQAFQFLQGAGVGEDVANLLLAKNRKELLAKGAATSVISAGSAERSQRLLEKREGFKNFMGGIGNLAGEALTNVLLGEAGRFDEGMSPAAAKAKHTGSRFLPAFDEIGKAHGLPDGLLSAIAYQESRINPDAVNPKSGARGLMQLNPSFHPNAGKDPVADIEEAATELERLFKQFGSWGAAVAAYNDGSGNITSLLSTGKRKNGEVGLPLETANYLANVLGPTPGAAVGNRTNSNSVTTGPVTIQTSATSLSGVGEDFSEMVRRKSEISQANTGMN